MGDKTGLTSSASASNPSQDGVSELAASLGEARRQLLNEVNLRRNIVKPLEQALRALKDPHRNAVALYEVEKPPEDLTLPNGYVSLVAELRIIADGKLSELEFTFARDLRAAFREKGLKLEGSPSELVADLYSKLSLTKI